MGGMGAVTAELEAAARAAGAELRCGAEVTAIDAGPAGVAVRFVDAGGGGDAACARRRPRAGQRRPRRARSPARSRAVGHDARGRAAEGQPAARAAAAAARPRRRPDRRLRRHLPRQRGLRPARARSRAGRGGRAARRRAVRDLLPLAHRSEHPRARAAGRGRPDADVLRAAPAHAPVRGRQRRGARARARGHPRARWTACSPSRSSTACGATPRVARASRRAPRSTSRPSSGCPAATSSTATSAGPSRRPRPRSAPGAWRPTTRACSSAAPARAAAAGSAACRAATRRWPCWGPLARCCVVRGVCGGAWRLYSITEGTGVAVVAAPRSPARSSCGPRARFTASGAVPEGAGSQADMCRKRAHPLCSRPKVLRKTRGSGTKARAIEDDGARREPPVRSFPSMRSWPRSAARRRADDSPEPPATSGQRSGGSRAGRRNGRSAGHPRPADRPRHRVSRPLHRGHPARSRTRSPSGRALRVPVRSRALP